MCTYGMDRHACVHAYGVDKRAYVCDFRVDRHAYVLTCGLNSHALGARMTGEKLIFFNVFYGQYG
jgi:hypothetical protein